MDDMAVYRALTEHQGSTVCELAQKMGTARSDVSIDLHRLFGGNVVDKMTAQYCQVCGHKETTWWARRSPFKKVETKYDDTPKTDDGADDEQGEDKMPAMVE